MRILVALLPLVVACAGIERADRVITGDQYGWPPAGMGW